MNSWEWAEMQRASENELIKEHDLIMASWGLDIKCFYFAAEIYHRRQTRIERYILILTIVITLLTAVNVCVVAFGLP